MDLARSARGGASYDASQLSFLLVPGIFRFTNGASLDPGDLVAAMGIWGIAEGHLAFAVADRERRTLARADQEIVFTREQEGERESAAQLLNVAATASTGAAALASSLR